MSTKNTTGSDIFSKRLKALRKERKKAAFAAFLGTSPQNYGRYEQGRIPDAVTLKTIADRCGVSVDWLLGREPEYKKLADGSTVAALQGAGNVHVLRSKPGSFGNPPDYHNTQWLPQWNPTLGNMPDDLIIDGIKEGVDRLANTQRGEKLQHLCHYIMDYLNELANRIG